MSRAIGKLIQAINHNYFFGASEAKLLHLMDKDNRIEQLLRQSETELKVIVFISAWSGGAHILKDKLEGVLDEGYTFSIRCLDLEQEPQLVTQMNVSSIPTTFLFYKDEMVERFTGVYSRGRLLEIMGPYLSTE